MNESPHTDWHEANQRYLMARVALVREALTRHARRTGETGEAEEAGQAGNHQSRAGVESQAAAERELCESMNALPAPSALDVLCLTFALSAFERDVLLMCAAMELDSSFAALCARVQADTAQAYPTFSLALAALPEAHWSALTPAAPLRRWRLIEVTSSGDTLTRERLRVDERVLHHLTGISYLDERLRGLVEPLELLSASHDLPASHRQLSGRIADFWANSKDAPQLPIVFLGGDDTAGKRIIAVAACAALGLNLHSIRQRDVPPQAAEREALMCLWEREAVFQGSALLIDADDGESVLGIVPFAEKARGALVVTGHDRLHLRERPVLQLDVHKPNVEEQRALWQDALTSIAQPHQTNFVHELNGHLKTLTAQFNLGVEGIKRASVQARELLAQNCEASPERVVWDACRVSARARLDDLARRVEPAADWEDLVLPETQLANLRLIAVHVRQRAKVYDEWNFKRKGERGLGISALFAGASGTGKTMAAEVLANELRLDLYRIDLSQVVSKYIGETEKNLRRVFDAAEESGAVLLFDEADALFGKRSEVKDSHDRYANIEVSYLLQRMEAYRGLAILTTNLKKSLDTAFLRRLRFVVQFPFPDHAQRAEIWRRIFPFETPTENLEVNKLARLNIAGGNIRNIALHAAFLAAEDDASVSMSHLLRAAHVEYDKLEKPLTETEGRGWT